MVSEIIYYCIVTTSMHFKLLSPIHSNFIDLTQELVFADSCCMFAELFYGGSNEEPWKPEPTGCSTSSIQSRTKDTKPSFTKKLKFRSVLEGEAVELKCELVASPPPSILWFHNNKSVPKARRRRVCSESQAHVHSSSLVIDRVKEKDSGSYKVMAINKEGSAESTASLLVSLREEQSANHLGGARRSVKARDSAARSAEHRQERKFRVDLRCVGSPFDQLSKARLTRSRSEASLVRSVYFRSGFRSNERAPAEKSAVLETASERAVSPSPMFDRSERFNDRFSDIYCDRRTGARFSDRFSDTDSLHNEVRTKLSTLQKAVKQRKRLSISTMSSSEFEVESVASEPSYADYVDRLRVRPSFLHDATHFNRHLDLGEGQQEFQSKNVSSVPSQSSVRHLFEPQSRTRAIQIMRGELVDTPEDKNSEGFLDSQRDDESRQEVSKCQGAVAGKRMEGSFSTIKIPYPDVPHPGTTFSPGTTTYPESGGSIPVVIAQEEGSLRESPTPKQVTTLTPVYTDSGTPEDKVDLFEEEYEGESFRSPREKGLGADVSECEQSRTWQKGSQVSNEEIVYHEIHLPNPTKRLVESSSETVSKTNVGYTEAIPLRKSTKIKASLQEDRVEEMMSDAPLLAKQMSPRLNIKAASQKKEFLPKGKAKIEDRLGASPRPHQYRSVKEKSLMEPLSAANVPAALCEPYQGPRGGGSLKDDYGKSLEAERIQCEEKLLALRIRKWQQGMQMSEDETHYPESDPMLAETSHLESQDQIHPQQQLRAKILSAEHSDLETQEHVEAEEEEKMLEKAGEEHGLHLSRDNLSELKHESEMFFSEDEALAQRIIKWQQDVVKEQAAELESNGTHPQVRAETTTELGEEVQEASSEILPQLKKSFSAKSAKDKFFMTECSADPQDQLCDYPQWRPAGRPYTERPETTLQRDSEDGVKKDKALAADNLKMQQNVVEKEHRAKIDAQSQQHVVCYELKAHSSSLDREDERVDIANEPYSVPLPSSSAHEASPLEYSVPRDASESEDMEMEKRQKKDEDAFFVDKAKSQRSTDIRNTEAENTENQQKTRGEVTIERCEYGPRNEEMFVQEKEANSPTSKRIKDDDDGAGGSPPVFVKEISSLKTKVGEMSEFSCQFHGDPLPTVTWLKDGQPLTHHPDFDIINRANKSKLTVFYPTADHEGTYDCLITNKYGKSLCSCTLEIAEKTARTTDVATDAAADLPEKGRSASVPSGKATLQVPEMVMHRQLCSEEPFSPSPVEIRITTATPVPEIRGENHETKPQIWTEEGSTVAAAEGPSAAVRHKFTFSYDVSEEEPTVVNTNYSEGITGDVQPPEIFHQRYQDVTHKQEKSICPQPEEAPRTKRTKPAVSTERPGISGCGLLASSAVIKVSEIKQAFEADSSVPVMAPPPQHDRKETAFPEEYIPAAAVSIDLRDNKGESPVVRDSSPNKSPDLAKPLPDGAEADVTEMSPASGALASDQSVSPQLPATTALTSSECPQPISLEENSRQACPKIPKGANPTEGDGASKEFLDVVQESSEWVRPNKPAHSPKQDSWDMETGMSLHTFDRSSSFIPFLSEKENLSMRTSGQLQATVKPKRTSGSIKPESQNVAVATSLSPDSEVDVVREVVPTDAKEASVLEESKEDQLKVVTDANIVTAALEYTEETSSELISKPEPTFDSGVFLSEVDTDITQIAEETPGYEGELDVLNNGAQERVHDPQTLLANPKVDDVPGQHHPSEDGAADSRVTSTQDKHSCKDSETKAHIATVGSLEEEEVTFGAVYDYYNLPADWRRPMSPESEMSIEFGSTMSEEITEVAERFFTPGSSSEVLQPLVEQFYTPTSPMAFHTPTSVTPGGFVTPQEYPFNPAAAQSPSSRQSSERFFTPHELLSSPVEWSMDTTAVNKNLTFNQGMESSSLGTLEEKAQGVPPAFLKPLMKKRVCENESLMFFAEVFGLPCPEVKWFCNNKQLVEDDRVKMERDGDTVSLTVLGVTKADQGEYICEAVNTIGEARSVALVVVVSQEVRFMPAPPAVTHQHVMEFDVEEDDTSRSPSPQEILLEVELDENEVKEFEKQVKIITIPEYTADNKSMIVSLDVLPSIYEEGAVDFVTHERDDLKIAFEVTEMPPRFINPICDMETPEGGTIIFECSLMGTPSPVVSWFKGDKKIPHNDKKYLHSSEGDNHFLKICAVTAQDSGVYICRAINVVGETLCRASLVVLNAKSFSGRTRGREVTAVSLGSAKIQPQKFDLLVGGKSFDGEQVSEIELEFEFDQEADESQRAVKLVARTDQQAETSEQGEEYVSINFDVFAEPAKEEKVEFKGKSSDVCSFQFQVTESPPKCIIPLSNITAAVGTPVILQCLVSGAPQPTAAWYKDGHRVTDTRCIIQEKTLGHFNLLITNVTQSDAGEYKCVIQNAAGFTETAALLKVF